MCPSFSFRRFFARVVSFSGFRALLTNLAPPEASAAGRAAAAASASRRRAAAASAASASATSSAAARAASATAASDASRSAAAASSDVSDVFSSDTSISFLRFFGAGAASGLNAKRSSSSSSE